jgi:putative PEP-CTERM system TPR-repeat lipoprotein
MKRIDMDTARSIGIAAASLVLVATLLVGCGEKPGTHVESAKKSLAKNDRSAAIIELKNALQIDPDLAEARLLLGKSLLDAGDLPAAEKELGKARELKIPDDQVVPPLARAIMGQNAFAKVIEQFGKVELGAPEARADLASTLGLAQMFAGNVDAARRLFADAQKDVPGYPAAMLGEARLKASAGTLPEATALVEAVLAKSPELADGWQLKGDIASMQSQPDNAVAAYRKVLELRADNLAVRSRLASILIQQGKSQEASAEIDAMKRIAPKHPQTLYLQALLALQEKNYTAAREAIQLQLRAAPDNVPGLVLEGVIAFRSGAFAQAESSLSRALRQAPKQRAARIVLVNTYIRNRQPAKALEALKPLLEEGEQDSDVLALAGEVYMQNGNTKEAEKVFTKASALDPKNMNKRAALALTHMSSGDVDRGFRELEVAAAADTGTRADLALIAANVEQRKYDAALKAIADLEKKQPDKPLPHNLRGTVYSAKGDTAAARRSFERALALDPADFGAAASLARLDLADKKPDVARARFEAVLAKDPTSTRSLLALAELRTQTGGTTDEVADLITRAIHAEPTSTLPRLVLINFYLRSKEPKKAVSAAQDALAAIPDRPELLDAGGRAQMAAGDTNQAIAAFTRLSQLRPDTPEPLMRIASAQMAGKDPDAAVQTLKKALALKPDLVDIQMALIRANLAAGHDKEAMVIARDVQKRRPKESVGYVFEGDIHAARRAWPEAAAAYRNGLNYAGSTDLATRLDAALRTGGSAAEADKFIAGWLRDHPKDRELHLYLAEMAIRKKDFPGAVSHYRTLLETRADDAMVLNNLAYASAQVKDPKALEYAEKAVKLAPNNPAVLDTYGMLLIDKGDTKRGVEYVRRASELAPAADGIRLNLARALIKDGQKAAAKKELDTLAQLGDKFSDQAEVGKLMQGL